MKKPERIDLSGEELEALLCRVEAGSLEPGDYEIIKAMAETIAYLSQAADKKSATIARLIRALFGSRSEKTEDVLEPSEEASASEQKEPESKEPPEKKKGHGRRGAEEYKGAERIAIKHETLKAGDDCPRCEKGTVYVQPPKQCVCIRGGPPLSGKLYEFDRLRCGLCGAIFTASVPVGLDLRKYDETSASMIALLKYGSGLPFNRLARLEGSLGIPLAAATQWDIVYEASESIIVAHQELIRQAARGEVLHNDDTGMKILEHMGKRLKKKQARSKKKGKKRASKSKERTGVFTSGIVSVGGGRKIVLFFTGCKHAGENLSSVLSKRAEELGAPIQMCDALSRNVPADFETILANCLAHGRRQFVDVAKNFPQECRRVLETLGKVYKFDASAREKKLSPDERLALHRKHSRPLMVDLLGWFRHELQAKRIEPNSSLGEAIRYMKKHWWKLTLFYRHAGAPLDNNLCERLLKKAILHRKNALFYKTDNGASVGDLFMSLICTAELSGVDPFDYLNELQRHSAALGENPAGWLPWSYRETLARLESSPP